MIGLPASGFTAPAAVCRLLPFVVIDDLYHFDLLGFRQ
jgi:hypothetical protein